MQYNIDQIFSLFKDRAGTRGISSSVSPARFNRWWNSAEIKFFNTMYDMYSKKQTISDSITKWMTDPTYLPIGANGFFNFFPNMNLLHVDSMSAFLVTSGTKIATLGTITPGSLYTDGSYFVPLTGGTGSGATAFIVVLNGIVVSCLPQQQGSGYVVGDTLSATLPVGSGFSIPVATLTGAVTEYKVKRVEKQRWAANVSSQYDAPTQEFPIYGQFSNSFQFAPANLGFAKTVYLQQPIWSLWAYNLAGYISTLTALVGGNSYVNGTYFNVPMTGGSGNGALATIIVSGGSVSSVVLTNFGKLYQVGDVLSANPINIGGAGAGFSINVSSLIESTIRPVYDPINSVQPKWNPDDVSTIIDLALQDAAIYNRDQELAAFANNASKSQQ
jgi:hypothetical protein